MSSFNVCHILNPMKVATTNVIVWASCNRNQTSRALNKDYRVKQEVDCGRANGDANAEMHNRLMNSSPLKYLLRQWV